jgi:formate dehydrogenase major subunit
MFDVTINGSPYRHPEGLTVLDAVRGVGIELPSLCHDDRLKPCGSCRLCLVELRGIEHPVAACTTPLAQDMEILTHTERLEQHRRSVLRMLADRYPGAALRDQPDKPFHQWLARYGLAGSESAGGEPAQEAHPYIRIDMSRCILCYRCVRICEQLQGQFVWGVRNRADSTRIVVRSGADLADSICVSCGACVDTCPTGALEDQTLARLAKPPDSWVRTTCPYCGTGCEMAAGASDGRLLAMKAIFEAPVSKGHLCVKGRYGFGFVHSADRVSGPMLRRGGQWCRVSWDEAIAFTAEQLGRIKATYGPDALGVLGSARATNEENYLAQKFARLVLGTHNVDCCARVCHAPTATAMKAILGAGAATNSFDDIEKARTILVWGANPTENHPIVGARIKQAALAGARLVVVDPRRTEIARYAQIHLAPRPGTDVAVLNAMANVIVEENLFDQAFLETRVAGWDEFRQFIRAWPPERVSEGCRIEAGAIRKAARLYATEQPSMSIHGLGITEHSQGTETVMCLVNLALLTGSIGKPGSGVNPLRGQNNVQGSAHMGCEPDHLTGYVPIESGRERFEAVWRAPLPRRRGLNLLEMMDAACAGQLWALWAIGYDVLLTNANASATRAALANLDLLVVQDMFLNETAREFGRVFLPACSSFEKDGTFMNAERRVQRVRKVLEPVADSRPDWEIICALAGRMGHSERFPFRNAEAIWDEVRAVWPGGAGLTYRRLESGGLQWPCPDESHPGTAILHTSTFPFGERAALRCIGWRPTAEQTDPQFPYCLVTGRTLYQFNAGTMTGRTPNTHWRPSDTLDISVEDARDLRLDTGERVCVASRYGSAELPVRVDSALRPGELFATFHSPAVLLNQVTGPHTDALTCTPEYKVTAVRIERV